MHGVIGESLTRIVDLLYRAGNLPLFIGKIVENFHQRRLKETKIEITHWLNRILCFAHGIKSANEYQVFSLPYEILVLLGKVTHVLEPPNEDRIDKTG